LVAAALTPELIAHIRTFKEDVPQSYWDDWNRLVDEAKQNPYYNQRRGNR
jgi:hypothetical protein